MNSAVSQTLKKLVCFCHCKSGQAVVRSIEENMSSLSFLVLNYHSVLLNCITASSNLEELLMSSM